jgi:hypothetical protein
VAVESFKVIQDPQPDAPTIVRFQQNVKTWTAQFDAPVVVPVLDVISSSGITQYTVKPDDAFLVVNARGGPIRIVLPAPNRQTQTVKIGNVYASNKVTVVQADGKAIGGGVPEITIPAEGAAEFVCNGRNWFRFDYGA